MMMSETKESAAYYIISSSNLIFAGSGKRHFKVRLWGKGKEELSSEGIVGEGLQRGENMAY